MRRAKRSLVSVLSPILIISLWLMGCGPTNGLPPLTGEFLYISNQTDGTISEFSINTATGLLTNVGSFNSTAPAGDLFFMAVHPTNEFIYAADTANFVLGFDIGDQGSSGMIFLRNSHAKAVSAPLDVAITPNGNFLYATSFPKVSEYSIDLSSGALKSIGSVSSGVGSFGVTVDSTGNYAYVANVDDGSVSEYVVQPNGTLTANGTLVLPSGSSPAFIATNPTTAAPSTECAYATDNGDFGLQEMAINTSTGTLTYLGSVPAANFTFGITVHPNGNFIYATQPFSDSIAVFTPVFNEVPTCTVALTSQVSVPVDSQPNGIAVEPMGRWAYTANFNTGKVGEFSIDGISGALTSIGEVNSENPPNSLSAPRAAVTTH